ncbi:fumarylacetoacetate hydrolase family protein [Polynucleobacter kasalickyi]|uniref:2-keto-4-pentenoate hydratase/2-oxohepta-3-ene-1,7-dioic acid hydratase (Catechol pathway) n=1 Tax=Polynucleobacter kasalickyi TaxID=1938817 RepID=A0A1W1Y4E6_9BURK|nr:fumarylacetoacetate hydrolase family protein [Polynucleobacter kasalickyi]SMC31019.1 2-keto-4-pentenoate hydratase/2-oxohepta-3-ene-1,7-dioic acid hydratase (catechol pathway) [Polynucleobacter kasalickyi]
MRIFTFEKAGKSTIGLLKNEQEYIDLELAGYAHANDMVELLSQADWETSLAEIQKNAPAASIKPLAGTKYDILVANPSKIICVGLNYADHAKEGGHAIPDHPSFFIRVNSSQVAHNQPMLVPKQSSERFDYEAELAVVIGKTARHLTAENALDCVAGYSCYNDGSVRDFQRKGTQWTLGKNFDKTGSFGPWLVTKDELPAGGDGLKIQARLNGQVLQDGNTSNFLFSVSQVLVILTEVMTLEPGDVIITGTPAGVGYARKPPIFMKEGDVCEIEIEKIGILSNPIANA